MGHPVDLSSSFISYDSNIYESMCMDKNVCIHVYYIVKKNLSGHRLWDILYTFMFCHSVLLQDIIYVCVYIYINII